jgi:hypothetical protein
VSPDLSPELQGKPRQVVEGAVQNAFFSPIQVFRHRLQTFNYHWFLYIPIISYFRKFEEIMTQINKHDNIIGVINACKPKGWGLDRYGLFFTEDAIIIAKTSSYEESLGSLLTLGVFSTFTTAHEAHKKESQMSKLSANKILSLDSSNYFFSNSEINEVQIKQPSTLFHGKIIISTKDQDDAFTFSLIGFPEKKHEQVKSFIDFLVPIFGNKLKVE